MLLIALPNSLQHPSSLRLCAFAVESVLHYYCGINASLLLRKQCFTSAVESVLQVLFSDETRLDLNCGQKRRWGPRRGARKKRVVSQYAPSAQFWAGAGLGHTTRLIRCDRMNSAVYMKTLSHGVLAAVRRKHLVFQQVQKLNATNIPLAPNATTG